MSKNRIASIALTHYKDRWSWFVIPWLIVASSFLINFITSLFVSDTIYTGGIVSIFIYQFAGGITMVYQSLPFLMGFGVRRQDYYVGTVLAMGGISLYSSLVLTAMSYLESDVLEGWGTGLYFFHLPYVSSGTLIMQFLVYLLLMLLFFGGGFVIGIYFKRFGRTGLYAAFLIALFGGTAIGYAGIFLNWWWPLFNWIGDHSMFQNMLATAPLTIILLIVSYLMLRRTAI